MNSRYFSGLVLTLALCGLSPPAAADNPLTDLIEGLGKLLTPAQTPASPPESATSQPAPAANTRGITAPRAERRVALVIGNNAYAKVEPLKNAVPDAEAMAREFRALGFEVITKTDTNFRDMKAAVREFTDKIANGGFGAFFYAGHGVQEGGNTYLLPIDVDALTDSRALRDEAVELNSAVIQEVSEAKAKFALLVVDACRNNPFPRKAGRGVGATRGLDLPRAPDGMVVVYSAGSGQEALDRLGPEDTDPNGLFTREFIREMRTPGLEIADLVRNVNKRVRSKAAQIKHEQSPGFYIQSADKVYLFPKAENVVIQQPGADPEAEAWAAADSVGSAAAYQAYLDAYPQGRYGAAARIKLQARQAVTAPSKAIDSNSAAKTPESAEPPRASAPAPAQSAPAPAQSAPAPVKLAPLPVPEDPETAFWNEVKASGGREYFEAYVKQYSKGKFLALARIELKKIDDKEKAARAQEEAERKAAAERERLAAIQADKEAWEAAKAKHTLAGYDDYLEHYPKGRYLALAEAGKSSVRRESAEKEKREAARQEREAKEAEERAWNEAQSARTLEALRAYLERYPSGPHATLAAERRRALEADAAYREESALWQEAQNASASATVERYLDRYPQGRYRQEAQNKLAELKKAEAELRPKVFRDCPDCPEMVVVPAGHFEMGSNDGDSDEKPVHSVHIGQAFGIGRTEVTQGQWRAIMGNNPSSFSNCGDQCPVENVSWNDAQDYVRTLSQKTGKNYRLPAEAEWEYAARAGTRTAFHTGNTITTDQANFDGDYTYNGSSKGEDRQKTISVGSFSPNAFGLYDMHGNVWEWVQDCWNDGYGGAPSDGSAWMSGNCERHVLRGGSWGSSPVNARSAIRNWLVTGNRDYGFGFRIARTLP